MYTLAAKIYAPDICAYKWVKTQSSQITDLRRIAACLKAKRHFIIESDGQVLIDQIAA